MYIFSCSSAQLGYSPSKEATKKKKKKQQSRLSHDFLFLPCFDSTFHSYKTTLFQAVSSYWSKRGGQTILISIANPVQPHINEGRKLC